MSRFDRKAHRDRQNEETKHSQLVDQDLQGVSRGCVSKLYSITRENFHSPRRKNSSLVFVKKVHLYSYLRCTATGQTIHPASQSHCQTDELWKTQLSALTFCRKTSTISLQRDPETSGIRENTCNWGNFELSCFDVLSFCWRHQSQHNPLRACVRCFLVVAHVLFWYKRCVLVLLWRLIESLAQD